MIEESRREAAVRDLRRAAEDGRLDPGSLDARTQLARVARTEADLAAALHGVSGPAGNSRVDPTVRPGFAPNDPLRLTGGASTERRRGVWEVPPWLRIHATMSSVHLDFLDATAAADVIDVEVVAGLSSIRFVVPDGWGVNVDRLGKGWGSVRSQVPAIASPGHPMLVVHGNVGAGSLKATGPSRRQLRRRAR